ncbi:MAG TPA: TerC family protein [Myxococcota bacterium]|nr:TerC family protein [Myxococcota bacterium]
MESIGTPLLWVGFVVFVLIMLAVDLGVFQRKAHSVSMREAGLWTVVWIALALIFNVGVYHWFGYAHAMEFLTGYLMEKALSMDNLFVFLVLFSYFGVPGHLQHRVLFFGILGALIMRALFIVAGVALISKFHWVMYIFGAFLVFTGIKLVMNKGGEVHPERNFMLRIFKKFVPTVPEYRGTHFVVREGGRLMATPLLAVLVVIEGTDVLFAVDSIPAVFGITRDPFIVFTSNIFAILGLRALYFLLAGIVEKFRFLKYGLGLVLAFVGFKMLVEDLLHHMHREIPIAMSLAVIAGTVGLSILISLIIPPKADSRPGDQSAGQ